MRKGVIRAAILMAGLVTVIVGVDRRGAGCKASHRSSGNPGSGADDRFGGFQQTNGGLPVYCES